MSITHTITNPTNIYRVRAGWYLQLQWAGRVYRELFSDSRYGGRDGSLAKATTNRDWLNKFRDEHETAVKILTAASESGNMLLYELTMTALTGKVRAACATRADRALFDEYFSLEPSYHVAA